MVDFRRVVWSVKVSKRTCGSESQVKQRSKACCLVCGSDQGDESGSQVKQRSTESNSGTISKIFADCFADDDNFHVHSFDRSLIS